MGLDATELQLGYVVERVDNLAGEVRLLREGVQGAVSAGVQDGIRALATNSEFGEAFWRKGFESMSKHATQAGSQWIGSRILTAMVLAVVSAGVAWLVKSGKI